MFVKLKHFEFKSHLIPSRKLRTSRQPLARVREDRGLNLLLPPHQLVRLPGDDEFVEKEAAVEGPTIVLEIRLRCGQRGACRL